MVPGLSFATGNFLNNLRKHLISSAREKKALDISHKNELRLQMELNTLQAKVNPHFLYNALNSIASLAKVNPVKTEQMALHLSRFYKKSIAAKEDNFWTLGEEIEMIKTYLKIEKIRFEEKLHYEINISDHTMDIMIPRFLLQPLIENAIKYGHDPEREQIRIQLSAYKYHEKLILKVHDGGSPFSDELIGGYGIQSVRKKLKLLFPKSHEIYFANQPEKHVYISFIPE
ncbi:MAG: hypothetical protein GY705_09580 [Bacteroidetes bacterium]|nr:hypothetical protein [Bacteroidota bacterium]